MTHTSDQDINNVDNNSGTSESQSIDINSINLNNHVPNDSESLPIEINHTSALHSNDGVIQNQGQLFVGNRSDVNESQSIDINSINLNNHVANDCESTSGSLTQQSNRTTQGSEDNIDIDEIATKGRESEREREGERERERERENDESGREKERKRERENEKERERERRRERERENDESGREKERKKERKSEKETERKTRRKRARESEREREREHRSQIGSKNRSTNSSNDSVITDEVEDSVASRIKRRREHNKARRRILTDQQQDDDDDANNSHEY